MVCPGYEVDHRIPLACGGADQPGNMQWLTRQANRKKGDLGCSRGQPPSRLTAAWSRRAFGSILQSPNDFARWAICAERDSLERHPARKPLASYGNFRSQFARVAAASRRHAEL
jgi:hypothetical protein